MSLPKMTNVELTKIRHRPDDVAPSTGHRNGGKFNQSYENGDESGVAGATSLSVIAVQVDNVEHEEDDGHPNCFIRGVQDTQTGVSQLWKTNKKWIIRIILLVLLMLYVAYFIWAMIHGRLQDEGSIRLLWVTCTVVVIYVTSVIVNIDAVNDAIENVRRKVAPHNKRISWILAGILFLAVFVYVLVDVLFLTKKPYNLVSGVGIVVYILLLFIFSYNPAKVKWRIVVWGIGLQFLFALLILRTSWGHDAFEWLGDRTTEFLQHVDAGSEFLFGKTYMDHFFAFKILPVVVFFSTIISMLYYLGVMQVIIHKVAWVMQVAMGTTAGESINAAGNIFIGLTVAPLMIRPLIQDMTCSEIHSVMTSGFATIAGSVLGAYILFGVPANHLLTASVMSAPAALAMSKLFYPETKQSITTAEDVKNMEKSPQRNVIEAASYGASQSIKLVANIAVNLIAFIALLAFLDATLIWFGDRVGIENLNFKLICSYVFYPFAFLMGADKGDCRQLATLLGLKTFLNEFVAYDHLGKLIKNKVLLAEHLSFNGTVGYTGDDVVLFGYNGTTSDMTLINGVITDRTEVISTYALCGFANFGSIGVMLGGLGAMAPHRKSDMAKVVLRAMIAGNVACFMTACIAGLLYNGEG